MTRLLGKALSLSLQGFGGALVCQDLGNSIEHTQSCKLPAIFGLLLLLLRIPPDSLTNWRSPTLDCEAKGALTLPLHARTPALMKLVAPCSNLQLEWLQGPVWVSHRLGNQTPKLREFQTPRLLVLLSGGAVTNLPPPCKNTISQPPGSS